MVLGAACWAGARAVVAVETAWCWRRLVRRAVSEVGATEVMLERMAARSSGRPAPVRAEVSIVVWVVCFVRDELGKRSLLLMAMMRGRVVKEAMVASSSGCSGGVEARSSRPV